MKNKRMNNKETNDRKSDGLGRRLSVMAIMGVLSAVLLAGCGRTENSVETAGTETAGAGEAEDAEASGEKEPGGAEAAGIQAETDQEPEKTEASEPETAGGDHPVTMADLLKENGNVAEAVQTPELPETVLWFNATYACLTYSNGWDWRWVAGREPTEENVDTAKYLLYSSWDVLDRSSGLETVNSLLEGGHRTKCRECMDNLKEWGLMNLSEARFAEEVTRIVTGERTDIDLGKVPGRYVVAYYMYHSGIEAEYITAWDLCRVNQLYADYYLCGFMDYEEAMDASLENSLRLQKMYGSWDEMMDAYMMGYQFWQGDLEITEDSPTKERRNYYEMLKNSSDSPYELDWNMELKKSW